MASSKPVIKSSRQDFVIKNQRYCKAITLNIKFGAEVMRYIALKYLKGTTLQEHLNKISLTKSKLSRSDLNEMKNDPDINKFEFIQLTTLLSTFSLILTDDKKHIDKLRKLRNTLAHSANAELDDDTVFNESSQAIVALAKSAYNTAPRSYATEMTGKINELRRTELVLVCCEADRILLNNESLKFQLVECNIDTSQTEGPVSPLLIKYGLTKFTKELASCMDVDTFAITLMTESIISDDVRFTIRQQYSNEAKMELLVLHLCLNASDKELRRFVNDCLRKYKPNGELLASMVEYRSSGKRQYDEILQESVCDVLKESLEVSEHHNVLSEDLHTHVEEELEHDVDFTLIENCFKQTFHQDIDSRANGFKLKDTCFGVDSSKIEPLAKEKEGIDFRDMKNEEFAQYVDDQLYKTQPQCKGHFTKAILKESIPPYIFKDMTKDDLKEVFSDYLPAGVIYGHGIKKQLMEIQNKIRIESKDSKAQINEETSVTLRAFDKSPMHEYSRGNVKPAKGNLLIPKHEFRYPPLGKVVTSRYVANEVVEFLAACINGRQNGTIHFGIKYIKQDVGQIIGIPTDCLQIKNIDSEIVKAIQICFMNYRTRAMAQMCVRPVHEITVEDGKRVLEVDVVPFHKYLMNDPVPIHFPLKGKQQLVYAVYDSRGIVKCRQEDIEHVNKDMYACRLDDRKHLEETMESKSRKDETKQIKLCKLLTQGNTYVTDSFIPVVVTGIISGSEKEHDIRQQLNIEPALTSAKVVFDFDSSTKLLEKVENGESVFLVKRAEDFLEGDEDTELTGGKPVWIYCNGYEKSPVEREREVFDMIRWNREGRKKGIRTAMHQLRRFIPKLRCKMIFLVYQMNQLPGRDPMFEMARDCILNTFEGECIVVSETEEEILEWKRELDQVLNKDEVNDIFISGMSWDAFSITIKERFHVNPDIACLLPCADGTSIHMTNSDISFFTDISIVSGEECVHEIECMNETDLKKHKNGAQECFYKGKGVSWWNFYFDHQVGKREYLDLYISEIKSLMEMESGKRYVEEYKIDHYPGAGGTTLGMHILWRLSQFHKRPKNKYRCCILKMFTESTAQQLVQFRRVKENEDVTPKPIVILLDNQQEETIKEMERQLDELSYKHAAPGKLFALMLIINRIPSKINMFPSQFTLTHQLYVREQDWFLNKYKEMENDFDKEYIDSLLAFNFMKESFCITVMQETTDRLMEGITETERRVLKCLALVGTFEIERHAIPVPVFDVLIGKQMDLEMLSKRPPFGILHSLKEREALKPNKKIWNVVLSESMELLVANRRYGQFNQNGVSILSQPLAKAILENIKNTEKLTLENLVDNLLDLVEKHKNESNPGSKEFIRIVCRLFIERQKLSISRSPEKQSVVTERTRHGSELIDGRDRDKFSTLILELSQQQCGSKDFANRQVLTILQRCFKISEDAMVGQQLSRFNIHINDFAAAEFAIEQSISMKPQNSFLVDTYGQVFKSNMEFLVKKYEEMERPFSNEEAANIFSLALKAVDKYREGQKIALREETTSQGERNHSCFFNGIRTALDLLETFFKFNCYTNHETFRKFLNDLSYTTEEFEVLKHFCDVDAIRRQSSFQLHLENSLRYLQERKYQVKVFTVNMDEGETILTLFERYDRMYGDESMSEFHLTYGIGLKPLMNVLNSEDQKKKEALDERVKTAECQITTIAQADVDVRDYIIYLGYMIIHLSDIRDEKRKECTEDVYRNMLLYSSSLMKSQCNASVGMRPYLETFLFHAMLHWPTESRISKDFDELCPPLKYQEYIRKWEKTFDTNHYLRTMHQKLKNKPKNFFALGTGTPGNDIVDLETIRQKWIEEKRSSGRKKAPVLADKFWQEEFVRKQLKRLNGVVCGSGNIVSHKVHYFHGQKTFNISMYEPHPELCNREVTFVLGFTWKGPTALYVEKFESDGAEVADMQRDEDPENEYENDIPKMEVRNKDELALFCETRNRVVEQTNEIEDMETLTANGQNVSASTSRQSQGHKKKKTKRHRHRRK